jgi:hypothetical protein
MQNLVAVKQKEKLMQNDPKNPQRKQNDAKLVRNGTGFSLASEIRKKSKMSSWRTLTTLLKESSGIPAQVHVMHDADHSRRVAKKRPAIG